MTIKLNRKFILATALFCSSFQVCAQRWYEIELILFERPDSPFADKKINEDFTAELQKIKINRARDLLSPALQQMQKNKCLQQHGLLDSQVADEQTAAEQTDNTIAPVTNSGICDSEIDFVTHLQESPLILQTEVIEGMETPPYLLAAEQLEFHSTVKRLVREGLNPLLHVGWRQPGSTEKNTPAYRLFGGTNFTSEYAYNGELKQSTIPEDDNTYGTDSFWSDNFQPPTTSTTVKQYDNGGYPTATWQLDGLFKVFLRGRYLNIKANFNLREETTGEDNLAHYQFDQFRRIISGEIHYFDHPRLGIIMQVRRYMH